MLKLHLFLVVKPDFRVVFFYKKRLEKSKEIPIDFTLLSFVKTFVLNVEYEFQNLCQLESQPLIALYCIDIFSKWFLLNRTSVPFTFFSVC